MKRLIIAAVTAVTMFQAPEPASAQSANRPGRNVSCYPTDRGCCDGGRAFDIGNYTPTNRFCAKTVARPGTIPDDTPRINVRASAVPAPAPAQRAAAGAAAPRPVAVPPSTPPAIPRDPRCNDARAVQRGGECVIQAQTPTPPAR